MIGSNPFVGPRPLETGKPIFGRDREIDELYYSLSAERIVLLHSPSGAGKSSLIRAGLIPRLAERFDVRGPTRVNTQPLADEVGVNRYVRSTNLGFEQGVPEDRRRREDVVSQLSIAEYVESRPRRRSGHLNVVLIFDQFEEILTADPLAFDAKREFFRQLGELLQDPKIWALFALREDYLAPLDPYADQVPTHLKNRFRLDLLSLEAAQEAMTGTAKVGGRTFAPDAATKLVTDLATMQVQQPDGTFQSQIGPSVEPLQLQVVCRGLWDRLPAEQASIDLKDVESFGDVTRALASYYESVMGGAGDAQRGVREWVGEKLITKDGIRGQVLRGAGSSEGLRNERIEELVNSFLVRAEQRAGAVWYELTHDRLIAPVRENNKEWFDANLSELQKTARLWDAQGRPSALLAKDDQLKEAQSWARTQTSFTKAETEFLATSVQAQAAEKERRLARRLRVLAYVMTLSTFLALIGGGEAFRFYRAADNSQRETETKNTELTKLQKETADQNKELIEQQKALSGKKAELEDAGAKLNASLASEESASAEAKRQFFIATWQGAIRQAGGDLPEHVDDDRSILLTVQARLFFEKAGRAQARYAVEDALQKAIRQRVCHVLSGHTDDVFSVAFAVDGSRLASGGRDGTVRVWDVRQPTVPPLVLKGHRDVVSSIAFAPDGNRLVSASFDRTLRVWDLRQTNVPSIVLTNLQQESVHSVAFARDGKHLASASRKLVWVWDLRRLTDPPTVLTGHERVVTSVAFDPEGNHLASASLDKTVRVWDLRRPVDPTVLTGHLEGVYSVAFAPDGNHVASASDDKTVRVWDLRQPAAPQLTLSGHRGTVFSVAFSPDGRRLASGSEDKTVRVWDLLRPTSSPAVLTGHTNSVRSVAFAPDANLLASGSDDKAVRVWNIREPTDASVFREQLDGVLAVALAPDGSHMATASEDDTVRVWDLRRPTALPLELKGHRGPVTSVAFAPDGNRLASGSEDKTLRVWNLRQPASPPLAQVEHTDAVYSVVFDPKGNRLAFGSVDQNVHVWDLRQPDVSPLALKGHTERVNRVAFAPNGNYIASASDDKTVRVWNLSQLTARPLVLSGHTDRVISVAFTPDGSRIASGSVDRTVRVWDLLQTATPLVLAGHADLITAVAFGPDGNRLASGSWDETVLLWDVRYPTAPPVALTGQKAAVTSVAYAPDGMRVASAMDKVHVWPLWTAAADYLCTRVWRNLSIEEWKFYIGEGIPYERTCPNLPPGVGAPGGPK